MAREKDTYLNKEGLEYYHQKVKREFATKQELNQGLAQKQDNLTSANAGEGINIVRDQSGKVIISGTHAAPVWGSIVGDITDQTDLIEYVDQNGGKIDSISVNGVEQVIDQNKNVDITIPTKLSDFSNDVGFITNTVNNLVNYTKTADLASVAITGNYSDLLNTPTIPTKTSDLTNDSGFISSIPSEYITETELSTALDDYYTKTETYTKSEVNDLIGAISTIDIQVVNTLPTQDISTTTIYLVPAETSEDNNYYDEYIYVNNSWELIGTTKVDLSDYYTKSEVNNLISDFVTDTEMSTALSSKQDTLTAGANIDITNDVISAVDTTYTAGTGLTLSGTEFSVDTTVIAEVSDIPTAVSQLTNDSGYITGVEWGDITGNIANQTDLADVLTTLGNLINSKRDKNWKRILAIAFDENGNPASSVVAADHFQFTALQYIDASTRTVSHWYSAEEIADLVNNYDVFLSIIGLFGIMFGSYQYSGYSNIDEGSYKPIYLNNNYTDAYFVGVGQEYEVFTIHLTNNSGELYDPAIGNYSSVELQRKLTAGSNIQISGDVISATVYTAGNNIDIENDVISTDSYLGGVSIDVVKGYLHNIPEGFTELQSITNDSNTRLYVGAIQSGSIETKIEMYIKFKCGTTSSNYLYQSRETSNGTIFGISGSGTGGTIIAGWNGSSVTSSIARVVGNTYEVKATFYNGTTTLYVKEIETGTEDTATGTYTWAVPTSGFWLFGNQGGNYLSSRGAIVYELGLVVDDVTVFDLIPAIRDSDSKIGFYDITKQPDWSNSFRYIGKAGGDTGELIAGDEAFDGRTINYNGDYYVGTNGITITKSQKSATIGMATDLIFDCGTSTINI